MVRVFITWYKVRVQTFARFRREGEKNMAMIINVFTETTMFTFTPTFRNTFRIFSSKARSLFGLQFVKLYVMILFFLAKLQHVFVLLIEIVFNNTFIFPLGFTDCGATFMYPSILCHISRMLAFKDLIINSGPYNEVLLRICFMYLQLIVRTR